MSSIVISGDTSGTVTLSAPAVAGSTTLTLPSTSGTVLTNKTAGTVLQVVNVTYGTFTSFTTSTYVDCGLSASITPTSSTSKILVIASLNGVGKNGSNTALGAKLLKSSSIICSIEGDGGFDNTTGSNNIGSVMITYLDSPATTSSTTYKVQCNSLGNAASSRINDYYTTANDSVSSMTLMEISA